MGQKCIHSKLLKLFLGANWPSSMATLVIVGNLLQFWQPFSAIFGHFYYRCLMGSESHRFKIFKAEIKRKFSCEFTREFSVNISQLDTLTRLNLTNPGVTACVSSKYFSDYFHFVSIIVGDAQFCLLPFTHERGLS